MSEWYYSNGGNDRQGPVSAEELAALHGTGQIRPDSLVWREGMGGWRPWKEMMGEVALTVPAMAATLAPRPAPTFATAGPDAPPDADGNPYSLGAPASASPYAAPKAAVIDRDDETVSGGRVVYAGLWKRFAASFIDNFVTTAISYAVMIPIMVLFGVSASSMAAGGDPFSDTAGILLMLVIYPILIALPAVYFGWMHSSKTKASLGKMAVGIKVVRGDGQRIGFWRGFLRYFAYMGFVLLTCGLGLLISALMTAFTERKQALHDMICDTLVVDKWAFTDHPEWQRDGLDVVTIVILALAALSIIGLLALYAVIGAIAFGNLR